MNSLDALLSSLTLSGPCATRIAASALTTAAQSQDYGVFAVDLAGVKGKAVLMERLQGALDFPEWFGQNWDALEDCLTDMSWSDHPGFVLLIKGGGALRRHDKPLFDTLVDVLKSAADYWRGQERPFWGFFLELNGDPTLPQFP